MGLKVKLYWCLIGKQQTKLILFILDFFEKLKRACACWWIQKHQNMILVITDTVKLGQLWHKLASLCFV